MFHRHLEQIIVRQNYAALQMPAILNGKVPNALGYYQGVSVFIDLDALTATPPDILSEAGINGNNLYAKFCEQKGHIAMPASEKIEHIFSELYDLPERMYLPYFKLKVQELLLFLDMLDLENTKRLNQYVSGQVETIKEIHSLMTSDLKRRYTIEELSKTVPDEHHYFEIRFQSSLWNAHRFLHERIPYEVGIEYAVAGR